MRTEQTAPRSQSTTTSLQNGPGTDEVIINPADSADPQGLGGIPPATPYCILKPTKPIMGKLLKVGRDEWASCLDWRKS
jgi:hypothetical protein